MQKYQKIFFFLPVVMIISLIIPSQVTAQADGFTESFDNSNLPGWERPPDTTIVNGILLVPPGGFALHFGDFNDISLSVKMRFTGEGEGVIRYYFRDMSRYNLFISPAGLSLLKEQGPSHTALGSAEATEVQANTWLTIKVEVSGRQHQIYVNDALKLDVNDDEPLPAGAIMLASQGSLTAEFDDLDVQGTSVAGQPGIVENPPAQATPFLSPTLALSSPQPESSTVPASRLGGLVEEFFASQPSTLELTTFLINLLLAAVCAYILSLLYIHWGSSLTNRRKFATNFILLTITTTFIIMVVGSSVALSLGLVGALSIVRFRTAVKEPEELAYLFVAIGIGIGLGDNQRLITLLALAVVLVIILLQYLFRRHDADVNLHLTVASHNPDKIELSQIMSALRPHVAKIKLVRFDETAETLEAAFLVEFGRINRLNEAKSALRDLSPSLEVTFVDNKGLW